MARPGKHAHRPSRKPPGKDPLLRPRLMSAQDTFRREGNIRIAPKHPGMGRR
jgi:hypothetical protein